MAQLNQARAIAYIRVSTEDQTNGPDAQRVAIEAWALRSGVAIAAWCSDIGIGGATPVTKRPALLEALGSLRLLDAGVLVAAKRDRLARDVVLAEMLAREVARVGASLRTADGISDADSPEGRMMRGILDLFSQYERDIIRARTKAALAALRARGRRTGGVPWGSSAGVGGELVACEAERAVTERARDLRASGLTLRAIAAELAGAGVVGRTGRPLSHVQVDRMLR